MQLLRLTVASLAAAKPSAATPPPRPAPVCDTVNVDVVVVGGGASGAYAAVRLKEDYNKTVLLIEKEGHLGGHVSTYLDPETNSSFEYGVQTFNDLGPARKFFGRMNVPVGPPPPRLSLTSQYVDFKTGLTVSYVPATDRTAAYQKFLEIVEPFEQYFLPGYWNFPEPSAIPEDLLLPFRQFVDKYGLHAVVNQVFEVTGLGAGDFDTALTLYVLGAFGPPMIRSFIGQGSTFVPASRRNIDLYKAIEQRLGGDVLYNSTVTQSLRSPGGHTLWVRDSSRGSCTVVKAKALLLAIEPTRQNMEPFSLDDTEKSVFDKFDWQVVQAGIVSHPSLPVNFSLVNTPAAAAPANYLELPKPNCNARFDYMGGNSNNFRVLLVGKEPFTEADAQRLVSDDFEAMVAAGTLPPKTPGSGKLKVKAWANHGAMHMHVPAAEIRAGFIQKLYGLQGYRRTWWTGGAFSVQFQSILWEFDDVLLEKMMAAEQ